MKNDYNLLEEAYYSIYKEQLEQPIEFSEPEELDGEYHTGFHGEVLVNGDPYYLEGEITRDVVDDSDYDRETGYGRYTEPGENVAIEIYSYILEDIPEEIIPQLEDAVLAAFEESGT